MNKKVNIGFLFVITVFSLAGCMNNAREITELPEVQWGFTTQNFVGHVPVTLESSLDFVRYAYDNGLRWIELRDPDAELTVDECREIAALARELGIGVNYSAQRGLLAEDFWEVFDRAVVNTALFDGLRTVRVLALRGEDPYGWTEEELQHMVAVANEALQRAAEHGVGFTVENADAALDGQGHPYVGMIELLDAMDPAITLQLDTANLFTAPVAVSAEEAEEFIQRYASRISYLHVKSAYEGEALPVLDGNPLGFAEIFSLLAEHAPIYAAIELGPNPDADSVYKNMALSIDYLREKDGFY